MEEKLKALKKLIEEKRKELDLAIETESDKQSIYQRSI